MKKTGILWLALLLIAVAGAEAESGVLVDDAVIANGRTNRSMPVFTGSLEQPGRGPAVRFVLDANEEAGQRAKIHVMRTIQEAVGELPNARGYFTDSAAAKLYESLMVFDIADRNGLFTEDERANLQTYFGTVLDFYLDNDTILWESNRWNLGANAMRIIASCALFSFNFPNDPAANQWRIHARHYFEKNLAESIDAAGAWVTDSPGMSRYALEYAFVTAMAFRNGGGANYFSNPAFIRAFRYPMHLLPPQQPPAIGGHVMIAGIGATDPTVNHALVPALAAPRILPHDPETASQLMWYWDRCGKPVGALAVLYIDTTITPDEPPRASGYHGKGTVVLRDNLGTVEESAVFTHFGPAPGIPSHDASNQADHGDFSFIWRGLPLIVHDGYSAGNTTQTAVTRAPWRHNLALHENAGDSPVLPLGRFDEPASIASGVNRPLDMYPDGVSQLLATPKIDYTAGLVRFPGRGMEPLAYYRHFLFLKPDALLVWDDVDATFPLQWNLWTRSTGSWTEDNLLHVTTPVDVDMRIYFPGFDQLNHSGAAPDSVMRAEWPLLMRASYGTGTLYFTTLDLLDPVSAGSFGTGNTGAFAADVLRLIVSDAGPGAHVGIISGERDAGSLITGTDATVRTIPFSELAGAAYEEYDLLVVGDFGTTGLVRSIHEYREKLARYVENGGRVLLVCRTPAAWLYDGLSETVFPPVRCIVDSSFVNLADTTATAAVHADSLWMAEDAAVDSTALAHYIATADSLSLTCPVPVEWSDEWTPLISLNADVPVQRHWKREYGIPRRIRVDNPASEDFFTLLTPRRVGEGYLFDVTRTEEKSIVFADAETRWNISAQTTAWTDANLSVMVSGRMGNELYAFDCTYLWIGDEELHADHPFSFYYSEPEQRGIIISPHNLVLGYSQGDLRLWAGEITFSNLFTDFDRQRRTFVTTVVAKNTVGDVLPNAAVHIDNAFRGLTDDRGRFPVRWRNRQPEIRVTCGGGETVRTAEPGFMDFVVVMP